MKNLSPSESFLMLIITGVTNIACFPALYILYKKKMLFHFYIGFFTFFTSFMYHSLESLDWDYFFLSRGKWHRLDNIFSIMCFIMLMIYWMDNLQTNDNKQKLSLNFCDNDLHLVMIGLFITLLMQQDAPWQIKNTIIPIIFFVTILFFKTLIRGSGRINKYYLKRGVLLLVAGVVCFVRGLDDETDYLRVWHGLWHCFVGLASFFLWQSIDKDHEVKGEFIIQFAKQPRFEFRTMMRNLLTCNWNIKIK